jgi:hypothetical protein
MKHQVARNRWSSACRARHYPIHKLSDWQVRCMARQIASDLRAMIAAQVWNGEVRPDLGLVPR